jgi:gliding motility-associated transport system ATP-binding protein
MIEAQALTRRYGDFTAVRDVSFTVPGGEILGILGPNGAGKTTTIRMITGFLPPNRGRVTVNGRDLFAEPGKARGDIGYLPETVALYPEMRVREYLAYRARLQGMSKADAARAIGDTVERCLLKEVEHQIIGTLSKGYRQRVGLAAAILHQPQVLILDEPTVGLDPKQIIAIRELIRELGKDRTLLLSTHILPEVEQLCYRVLIIDRGRIIADGTPAELRAQARGNAVLDVTVKDAPPQAGDMLAQIPGVTGLQPLDGGGRFRIECGAGEDLRETVFRTAVDKGWVLLELAEKKASLEDIFVRLTADAAAADLEPPPETSLAAAMPEPAVDEGETETEEEAS